MGPGDRLEILGGADVLHALGLWLTRRRQPEDGLRHAAHYVLDHAEQVRDEGVGLVGVLDLVHSVEQGPPNLVVAHPPLVPGPEIPLRAGVPLDPQGNELFALLAVGG